jgi:hypothetical protein
MSLYIVIGVQDEDLSSFVTASALLSKIKHSSGAGM